MKYRELSVRDFRTLPFREQKLPIIVKVYGEIIGIYTPMPSTKNNFGAEWEKYDVDELVWKQKYDIGRRNATRAEHGDHKLSLSEDQNKIK